MFKPLKELNRMTPYLETKRTYIYLLEDGSIALRFKHLSDYDKKMFVKKYEYAKGIDEIKGLIIPFDILETEKGFAAYIEKNIYEGLDRDSYMAFADYYNAHHEITLDKISQYIYNCAEVANQATKAGIVIPDMPTGGNVLYNPESDDALFLDYHHMQVGDIPAEAVNSFVASDPILYTPKYSSRDMWKEELNSYMIAIRYFYYSTKLSIPRNLANGSELDDLIYHAGAKDSPLGDYLKIVYDQNKKNEDISEVITEMNNNYVISEYKTSQSRSFIKK